MLWQGKLVRTPTAVESYFGGIRHTSPNVVYRVTKESKILGTGDYRLILYPVGSNNQDDAIVVKASQVVLSV